ncbi:uncharacterized protein LOC124456959 [Xenia sp. Carnegie-2017]|uniref:uncharacterized protein LOC124456959 n=1 Tax=Xenia sp. Carnegie-2017 TaxID=2897299 RepID=UPI001F04EA68|nr:uncharacterized protein LOC124456959 [Xenia sp. Carnegie-2017]
MKRVTTREKIECSELCKTIRKKTRQNLREANTKRIREAVESGKGLKKSTTGDGKKALIQALKEKDGKVTTDRKRILERCAEFYQALYEDPSQNIQLRPAEETPVIMKCEVEKAIHQMKNGKSPVKILW